MIRPFVPEDRPNLLKLVRQVWSHKRDIETEFNDRWWWREREPPLVVADAGADGLVGLCARMSAPLRAQGRDLDAAWLVDFYVRPEFQGRGLGRRLTEFVEARHPVTASLSQTGMAYRVFSRMGWTPRTPVPLYMHPLPARAWFRIPADCRIATFEAGAVWPGADLDRLWTRVRDRHGTIARRDAAAIATRFGPHTGRPYTLVGAYRGPECAGFAVLRTTPTPAARPAGLIVDLLAAPEDETAMRALVGAAAAALRTQGAGRIYCLASTPALQRVLARRGFLSPGTPVLGRRLVGQIKWLTYHSRISPDPIEVRGWWLTLADCDLDLTWP